MVRGRLGEEMRPRVWRPSGRRSLVCRLRGRVRRIDRSPPITGSNDLYLVVDILVVRLFAWLRLAAWQESFGIEEDISGMKRHGGQEHQTAGHFGSRPEHQLAASPSVTSQPSQLAIAKP